MADSANVKAGDQQIGYGHTVTNSGTSVEDRGLSRDANALGNTAQAPPGCDDDGNGFPGYDLGTMS